MLRRLLLLILFCRCGVAYAQHIERTHIMTLPDTSTEVLQHASVGFDTNGNYVYYTLGETPTLIYTATRTYGPFKDYDRRDMSILCNKKGKDQYILRESCGQIYGPIDGEISGGTGLFAIDNVAYTVSNADSITYYINGRRIAVTDSATFVSTWCRFSRNGNVLYSIKQGPLNYLYFNYKLVDSSIHYFQPEAVDDRQNYTYYVGDFVPSRGCFSFRALRHAPQKTFVPIDYYNNWQRYDSMVYFGNGQGLVYPVDPVYAATTYMRGLRIVTKGKTLFTYDRYGYHNGKPTTDSSSSTTITINGKRSELPYLGVILPSVDSFGHYACFGRRGYYIYKNVDGVEAKKPLSKHSVRATPLSIDVKGNTICYYATDDSVYVYENDRLFAKCAAEQFQQTSIRVCREVSPGDEDTEVPILCMDSVAYLVYNGVISPAIPRVSKNGYYGYHSGGVYHIGDILYANANDDGYCVLQKTGEDRYLLLMNNKLVPLPTGIGIEGPMAEDLIYNFRFSDHKLVIYAKDGQNIYRYKITL